VGEGTAGNIILTGFSYTGKTQVGLEVARKLGWRFVDTDEEIIQNAGKPISEIFAYDGEDRFRQLEREILEGLCQEKDIVISTGGGAFIASANRELMLASGVVICLEARPDTVYHRLLKDAEENPDQVVRPLLNSPDPLKRIMELKRFRQPYYAVSDWTVHTDNLTVEEAAEEVIHGWRYIGSKISDRTPLSDVTSARESESPYCEHPGATCVVKTATECYPIFVGWGILDQLGERMRSARLQGKAHIVSDDAVFPLHGEKVKSLLTEAGFIADSFVVPSGENSKSFETAVGIYDWLVEQRAERGDNIVALGGGVIGDLAGFVASTFLRGVPLVQMPTSLIGMVDSAIGGKVGVNHPQGKNLIGAFYQPQLVLADIQTLTTLPRRELVSGWAEVIKHALIRDPRLFELLEARSQELLDLEEEVTAEALACSAAIKAAIVSEDEKEKGIRTILNYGHTIAHGLEAATNYGRFLHGEAVAIGMTGAAEISQRLGLLDQAVMERQREIIGKFDLPATCTDVNLDSVLRAMELDKKVKGAKIRWVLLSGIGQTVIRDNVPPEVIESVIRELLQNR
jgi:3-dehydroquinate synthase